MSCVSILICSFSGSKYLHRTLLSLTATVHRDYELLVDVEKERTGLVNTPGRYQGLFARSSGDYIVKSDDDIHYFDGWLDACIDVLRDNQNIGYVSPLNHLVLHKLGLRNLDPPKPIISEAREPVPAPFLSGGCWVFRRWLWQRIPYASYNGIKSLDSNFGATVRKEGLQPAYLPDVLCSHLGVDRHGGVSE